MLEFQLPWECVNIEAFEKIARPIEEQPMKEIYSITISKDLYDRLPNEAKELAVWIEERKVKND